jgi:hypothetical protein
VACTRHDRYVDQDYALLREAGISTAREGVRWPLCDRDGSFDFSSLDPMLRAAQEQGVQLIYDLFHYGYPDDVDPFSEAFVERFEEYCFVAAKHIARNADGPYFFTPVNEPSYCAYTGGEAGVFAPHVTGRSYELKMNLARAGIRGIEALWSAIPGARILNVDPICRVACPRDRPEMQPEVDFYNNVAVFESFDMLCGRLHPELGGSRRHLDIVGVNYYWTNQWEHTRAGIPLAEDDDRAWSLSQLIKGVWERYGGEVCLSETAHVGDNRARWMRTVVEESEVLLDAQVPLVGVCLYPILGMPEWHEQEKWTQMGLWDVHVEHGDFPRIRYEPLNQALAEARSRIEPRLLLRTEDDGAYVS